MTWNVTYSDLEIVNSVVEKSDHLVVLTLNTESSFRITSGNLETCRSKRARDTKYIIGRINLVSWNKYTGESTKHSTKNEPLP